MMNGGHMDWKEAESRLITQLLDGMAQCFDRELPMTPETLMECDGYQVTARQLLQSIRLHEAIARLE